MIKFLSDVITSAFGLLLLFPIIAIVAWLIRRKHSSRVLFRQIHPGLNAKPFEMIKLRTMHDATALAGIVRSMVALTLEQRASMGYAGNIFPRQDSSISSKCFSGKTA